MLKLFFHFSGLVIIAPLAFGLHARAQEAAWSPLSCSEAHRRRVFHPLKEQPLAEMDLQQELRRRKLARALLLSRIVEAWSKNEAFFDTSPARLDGQVLMDLADFNEGEWRVEESFIAQYPGVPATSIKSALRILRSAGAVDWTSKDTVQIVRPRHPVRLRMRILEFFENCFRRADLSVDLDWVQLKELVKVLNQQGERWREALRQANTNAAIGRNDEIHVLSSILLKDGMIFAGKGKKGGRLVKAVPTELRDAIQRLVSAGILARIREEKENRLRIVLPDHHYPVFLNYFFGEGSPSNLVLQWNDGVSKRRADEGPAAQTDGSMKFIDRAASDLKLARTFSLLPLFSAWQKSGQVYDTSYMRLSRVLMEHFAILDPLTSQKEDQLSQSLPDAFQASYDPQREFKLLVDNGVLTTKGTGEQKQYQALDIQDLRKIFMDFYNERIVAAGRSKLLDWEKTKQLIFFLREQDNRWTDTLLQLGISPEVLNRRLEPILLQLASFPDGLVFRGNLEDQTFEQIPDPTGLNAIKWAVLEMEQQGLLQLVEERGGLKRLRLSRASLRHLDSYFFGRGSPAWLIKGLENPAMPPDSAK
ncbi:MAG: hypothetical protein C5B49_05375 [Bdellovibrio sp.]|nr:MAG: hypothetical protein C5B49_05375 [Bdellovibrio sp.]